MRVRPRCLSRKPETVPRLDFCRDHSHPGRVDFYSCRRALVRRLLRMRPVLAALLAFAVGLFRSWASLCLEHLALRHPLAVYTQSVQRPRLCWPDRQLWSWLSQRRPSWRTALAFVQPRTVIAWQRQRCCDHWRRLSQPGTPGRPRIARMVKKLMRLHTRSISAAHPAVHDTELRLQALSLG